MKHGTRPAPLDSRDYSFHRTFPLFAATTPERLSLLEYSLDAGLDMPDQLVEGYPFGCTGYTQTNCKQDQDKILYDPGFTYRKTSYMEGHEPDQGCDIRTAAKSLRVYGALPKPLTAYVDHEKEALNHKSGKTFNVDRAPGRDWFDSFRIALRSQRAELIPSSISIGTPWYPEWSGPPQNGLLPAPIISDTNWANYNWHNFKISGEKTIGGEPTLEVKSWQGKSVGVDGWLYLNREAFNKAFDSLYGTLGLITATARPEDIYTIKLDILQTILVYLNRMLAIIGRKIQAHA